MDLKPCRDCGKKLSTDSNTCPSCGAWDPTRIIPLEYKKNRNIYEDVWVYAKKANDIVDATYIHASLNVDRETSFRMFSIAEYFYRGIFEASCEHHNLEKKDFKKAIILCFRQRMNTGDFKKMSNEEKDNTAENAYQCTENGLRHDDRVGKMCQHIINIGKKSFKTYGSGCFSELVVLWKDKNIYFSESGLKRNIEGFFKKLF